METNINENRICINKTVDEFFRVFTNKNSKLPDIDALHRICIAETLIVQKAGVTQNIYTIESFATSRRKILTDGTLTEFEERETFEETKIFRNIAHRNSRYEKSGVLKGEYFHLKGYKLFQFIKLDGFWRISSLIWEDELPSGNIY